MFDKLKNLIKKEEVVVIEPVQQDVQLKEDSELDFWINVWDKEIRDRVVKKNNLGSEKHKDFKKLYNIERIKVAQKQLDGILWMAKKPAGYLDNKVVVEIGPGCCCALEITKARIKIGIEPIAQRYMDNNLLLEGNDSVIYLTQGSEKMPIFSNYADIVIASNCLDHVEDLDASLKEIKRVLKPGGELFLNIEIDHEPTACEPFALSYEDVKKYFGIFKTVFINKTVGDDKRVWVRAVYKK